VFACILSILFLGLDTHNLAKESKPISGAREITLEPESVSFNDDFIAGSINSNYQFSFYYSILVIIVISSFT
jgi:hypothetical protein